MIEQHVWVRCAWVENIRCELREADRSDRTVGIPILDPVEDVLHFRIHGWRENTAPAQRSWAQFSPTAEDDRRFTGLMQYPGEFLGGAGCGHPASRRTVARRERGTQPGVPRDGSNSRLSDHMRGCRPQRRTRVVRERWNPHRPEHGMSPQGAVPLDIQRAPAYEAQVPRAFALPRPDLDGNSIQQ